MKSLYIVTGSHKGLGKAIAEQLLLDPDNDVIGLSRQNDFVHERFRFVSIDLNQLEQVKKWPMPYPIDSYERLVLINNAGILGEVAPLQKINLQDLESVMNINYQALMILSVLFIQAYQSTQIKNKIIINISSGAASNAYASWANYCSSKAALEMLTKAINLEQHQEDFPIKSFAIAPGVVDTDMQKQIRETDESNFSMQSKFVQMYQQNELYDANSVAKKIIEVTVSPEQFTNPIFRVTI
jgi:benzil reductase ((S)-benzoin forming)